MKRKSLLSLLFAVLTGMAASALAQTGPEYPFSSLVVFPPPPLPPAGTWAWARSNIESFAWPTSVKPGETVTFYTSVIDTANHPTYRIQVFRMGESAPRVTLGPFTSHFYPLRAADGTLLYPGNQSKKPVDFKSGCSQWWASSAQPYTIPTTGWTSGIYYAIMRFDPATADTGTAYFVVRAAIPGATSRILFKFPMNTHQAYTYWGGGSLYSCSQDPSLTVTDTIAIDRPWRPDFSESIRLYSVEKYFITWAESNGYAMEYCDNTDVDKNESNFLSNYKFIVHVGHDEYWSGSSIQNPGERASTENFKNAGGNLAFFATNTCYWRIYWLANAQGAIDYKRLKCKKGTCDGTGNTEDLWRLGNNNNPEAFFIGSQYETGYNSVEIPAQVTNASHWVFKDTNPPLQNGNLFGLGDNPAHTRGILGPEIDNTNYPEKPQFPFLGTLEIMAERDVWTLVHENPDSFAYIKHQATYYEDTQSNARVFNAATIQWARGLVEYYDVNDWNRMKQITDNIVAHFSFKKYLGKIYANLLTWGDESLETATQLDGDTDILANKTLNLTGNFTLTIDPGVTLYVDGTLSLGGNVTITGGGSVVTRGSGAIKPTSSADALAVNNSRKMVRDAAGDYHLVFENGGEIYYEKLINGGTALSEFRRLSAGNGSNKFPGIAERSGKLYVVWQRTTGTNTYTIHFMHFNATSWETIRTVTSGIASSNNPLPVEGVVSLRIFDLNGRFGERVGELQLACRCACHAVGWQRQLRSCGRERGLSCSAAGRRDTKGRQDNSGEVAKFCLTLSRQIVNCLSAAGLQFGQPGKQVGKC